MKPLKLGITAWIMTAALAASAQQAVKTRPTPPPVYGAVQLNVICSDTNLPARLAQVTLYPIPGEAAAESPGSDSGNGAPQRTLLQFQTRLDGSVLMPRVLPGRYYIVVQKPGYLSPTTQFSIAQIEHPDASTREAITKFVPVITVAAEHTSAAEVRLIRGAGLSGIVRFEDGTPATEMPLEVERRAETGTWGLVVVRNAVLQTDE